MSPQEGKSAAGATADPAATTTTTTTTSSTSTMNTKGRIPLVLVPVHYDLWYQRFCLQTFRFEGVVTIQCRYHHRDEKEGRTNDSFHSVSVHAADLQLTKAEIRVDVAGSTTWGGTIPTAAAPAAAVHRAVEFRHIIKDQVCEIRFDRPVTAVPQAGNDDGAATTSYHLTIHFTGCLNDQMRGLYRSTYQSLDDSNKSRWILTTQMEPTDARRAFPCFDEPALKATFALKCTVPTHLQCLSNTPIASCHTTAMPNSSSSSLVKTVTFQTTPKMSTYLVALIIGQFDSISTTGEAATTTVYTVPGKAHQAEFCLDTASRCLDLFQNLFQIPYPLAKSDLVAIPDFAAGAMENWGLVTYREAKVLVQPGSSSESARRGIARTICHELAHQWFGNLVTPEFWTQLWLKEGAARFLEFVATDSLFPEWNMWTEFVQSVLGLALHLDAMTEPSSHPVEVEVSHPDDINDIFDAISYAKGASIIRMISHVIGRDDFFRGMRLYLERHAYGNAVTNDLWGALEEASRFPVVEFMVPWTLKAGFPLLELDDKGNVRLCRFLAGGREETSAGSESIWPVPVTALVNGMQGVQGPWILNGPQGRDDSENLKSNIKEWTAKGLWFKLNVNQTGFYRVSYTSSQWERLAPAVNPTGSALSTSDRLGLVSDSFAAGRAGYSSLVDSLRLVSDFGSHEVAEYSVWQELSENLAAVASLFRSESFYPNLQRFLRRIYSPQLQRLGWEAQPGEDPRVATLRALVIGMLGRAGDADVARRAFELLVAHSSSKGDGTASSSIAGDLQETIFRCALRHDESAAFDILLKTYERSTFPEEQRNALSALGCVKDPKLHSHMLEFTLFSGKVRRQDIMFPLGSLAGSSDEGGVSCWQFFTANYNRLYAELGSGPMWPGCVGLSCRGLRSLEAVEEVERFFATHEVGSAQRRLTQALEVVQVQIRRRERDRNSVESFLRQY